MDESDIQFSKDDDPRISTFRGISIDRSDEYENANDSIRFNRESDSNEMDESDLHDEKHDDPRISTFRGISIDRSDEYENADDSIRFNCESDSNMIDWILGELFQRFGVKSRIERGIQMNVKVVWARFKRNPF
jgi:hypothetical protein